MPPRKFRSRVVEVEAVRWTKEPDNTAAVVDWTKLSLIPAYLEEAGGLVLRTTFGDEFVARPDPGDWIVRGPNNLLFHLPPSEFTEQYEPVEH